jgi:hypothetical protein
MKTKKFEKRLALNKETIADLKSDEMKKIQGGYDKSILLTTACCIENSGVSIC